MVKHIIVIKKIYETKFDFNKFETIHFASLKNKYLTKYFLQFLALFVTGSTAEVIPRWSNLLTVQ